MAIRNYRSGGFVTDTPSDFINLWGQVATSGQVATFRASGTTSGYQVTASKQFYICKIVVTLGDDTGNNYVFGLGYADNDCGLDTATARTNPVPILGRPEDGSTAGIGGIAFDGTGTTVPQSLPHTGLEGYRDIIWKGAPSGKYMYMRLLAGSVASTGVCVTITGFEV